MIVGITRFSVLSAKGWVLSRSEDPAAALFAPDRLAAHFALFEAVTLPFMKSETHQFLILTSTLLPEPWRARLLGDVAGAKNIHIRDVAPDGDMTRVLRRFVTALREKKPKGKIVTYRLDDDDGLAVGRGAVLKRYSKSGAEIIAHRNGLYVRWDNGLKIADVDYESIAAGTAFVSDTPRRHISLYGGHTRWTQQHTSLIVNEPASWLRTIHAASDSYRDYTLEWRALAGEDLERFRTRFPYIDTNRLGEALKAAVPPQPAPPIQVERPTRPWQGTGVRVWLKKRTGI